MKIFRTIHRIAHAIEYRAFLMSELMRLRRKTMIRKKGVASEILRNPSGIEDCMLLARLVDIGSPSHLIDIGGNTGYWAESISKFFNIEKITAFEPDPKVAKLYRGRFNSNENVTVHSLALSDRKGIAQFNLAEESTFSTLENYSETQADRQIDLSCETIDVPLCRLDDVEIALENNTRILKIDVQGHEAAVIKGGINTIAKCDIVIVELSFSVEYENVEPSFSAVCSMLYDIGFFPLVFKNHGKTLSPYAWERDVIFVKESRLNRIWGWE